MPAQRASPDQLLTPAEVAALLYVDPKTVSRWARAGRIPSVRTPGGHRRFRRSDVQALVQKDWSRDHSADISASPSPDDPHLDRADTAATRKAGSTAADAVFAEAVAIAMEAQAEAAAEAVLETAVSAALAAETAAAAALDARRARAFAAAEAAQGTPHHKGELARFECKKYGKQQAKIDEAKKSVKAWTTHEEHLTTALVS